MISEGFKKSIAREGTRRAHRPRARHPGGFAVTPLRRREGTWLAGPPSLPPGRAAKDDQNRAAGVDRLDEDAHHHPIAPGFADAVLDRLLVGQEGELLAAFGLQDEALEVAEP